MRIGDRVRCARSTPSRGTWGRYVGKVGLVTAMQEGEVRVEAEVGHWAAWFLPEELEAV